MSLTYENKRNILNYMGGYGNWSNVFDMSFFTDEKRKWNTRRVGNIRISRSPERDRYLISDLYSGAFVFFEKNDSEHTLTISDESDRVVTQKIKQINEGGQDGITIAELSSEKELMADGKEVSQVSVSAMSAYVRFKADGAKTVFLPDLNKKVDFDAPSNIISNKLPHGRFFHVIPFHHTMAQDWGINPIHLLDNSKLIISRDLGVEPNLEAINELDMSAARKHIEKNWYGRPVADQYYADKEQVKFHMDLSPFEVEWHDSTQFSGFEIATPRMFSITMTDEGFEVATSLDDKEMIWSKASVFNYAVNEKWVSVPIVPNEITPKDIFALLEQGAVTQDHRGRNWTYAHFSSRIAPIITKYFRKLADQGLGLSSSHFAALNHEENTSLVAMDSEALKGVSEAYSASVELLEMIQSGSNDAQRMENLLGKGADLKLVEPEAIEEKRTFANVMLESGNTKLFSALSNITDIHDTDDTNSPAPGMLS